MHYLWLFLAIVSEVVGTTALKASTGFTRVVPTLIVIAGYGSAIFFLTLTVQKIPTGVAYALWSGIGLLFIVILAWIFNGERVDAWGWVGFALIIAGVLVLNLLSKNSGHGEDGKPAEVEITDSLAK
ncbi:MAG: multidrug efflux SMR transporter [Planctomycetota bacterium]|nr:multidrug efflux SMR transporter [Planctomycetota bacterium]